MRVIATAGHVDHGKSTLVWALTGADPDRWPEEKARGLTIDLGFAATALPSGRELAFVDVPGHGRFLKNMLAGVGLVDAALFVVAATEGWKPQSEEHLRILELLGIGHGVVALTKVGLVPVERRPAAEAEVREHLSGTFLAGAEVVAVDVPAGLGIDALRDALDRLTAATPPAPDRGRPRLWVDRSFAVRGAGTVVTGTLRDGTVRVGDELVVAPGGQAARVRGLQSHDRSVTEASPGRRLAVNLTGLARTDVVRGQALVRAGQWHPTTSVDASLTVLGSVEHPVSHRGAYVAHLGSGDFPARMRVLGGAGPVEAGGRAAIRLWLQGVGEGLALLPGDRYVLREIGRMETVGGGEILDVDPVVRATRAAPSRSVERVVRERAWVDVAELARLTGTDRAADVGRWVVDPPVLTAMRDDLARRCRDAGATGIDLAALDEHQRAVLAEGIDGVTVEGGRAVDASAVGSGLSDAATRVLGVLEADPWTPPTLAVTDRGALRELERRGLAVEAEQVWFAASAIRGATAAVARLLADQPDGFTVAEVRTVLGTSRKFALPLLNHLDAAGITRRREDRRVAGPRLPG